MLVQFSLVALAGACSLPLVEPTGPLALDLARFPTGSVAVERVAVERVTGDGVRLRGVFVPAEPVRGVVLHLLPRGYSAARGHPQLGGYLETLAALRALGFASLVMDYRGVGVSDGEPSPAELADDASAMWDEARARDVHGAGIVVRAASLGTLAWATLHERGAAARAVILAAPIDARTIVANALRQRLGGVLAFLVRPWFVSPRAAGLAHVVATLGTPVLLLLPSDDALLPPGEQARLLEASAGARHVTCGADHEQTIARFWGFELDARGGRVVETLTAAEVEFLAAVEGARAAGERAPPE